MSEQSASTSPSGKPGRYKRSTAGLVVSLLVSGIGVVAFIWFLSLFRSETIIEPEPIAYLDAVANLQSAGTEPVYPATLPEGWFATGVDVEAGPVAAVGLKFLTDEGRFVGIRQEQTTIRGLLNTYVPGGATEAQGYTSGSSVARVWDGYTDSARDTAYAAEVGDEIVLVYGSAPPEDLQALIDLLTTDPVE
jgi:hypothetical protein